VLPAARLLGAPQVRLLVVEDGEDWRACLPVERSGPGPLSVWSSWKHLYCFLGTPLLDREGAHDAAAAVAAWSGGEGGPLALRMTGDKRVLARLVNAGAENGLELLHDVTVSRAALVRSPQEDYLAGQRSHRRREQARMRRRLGEELGAELRAVDRAGEQSAVESFLSLEAAGWKGREGTAFASDPAHAEFFRELCRSYAEQGRLQLLSLESGSRVVAMKCNLISGDELFCFKIAHDESLSGFSPGVLLELDNMTIFHNERSERIMDSCADPDNQMINRLWRDRRRIATVLIGRRDVRGRLIGRAVRLYSSR
jgi:CelD/BcsL family acetyltransferase involved in cellulose biosynthesis